MKIYESTLAIPGSKLSGENPQPYFRAKCANIQCTEDGTLQPQDHIGYGVACAERTLPYRMQDRYDRSETTQHLKAIILENDCLRATFLPQLGGKLWSLYAKPQQRELLFVNPVLRFANLAIRNAWVAGGIEWNLGHTGHSAFTSTDMFCAKVTAPDGEEFLRMYEYEAAHAQVLQIDFHLPDGAQQLAACVRIQNARNKPAPLYWWTNTAVPLTDHTRVLSGTSEILYQLAHSPNNKTPGFGHGAMPCQPSLPGVDLSKPGSIPHSLEYFFQNEHTQPAPWETSIESDGIGFFERSTQPLRIRKLFCWGISTGGKHWCDYLARKGQGSYIEIQAGLAPTQLHTDVLAPNGTVMFTQMFGALSVPQSVLYDDWHTARQQTAQHVEQTLPAAQVNRLHAEYALKSTLAVQELLHTGGFYGALEQARRQQAGEPPLAQHLQFDSHAHADVVQAWCGVLNGKPLPNSEGAPLPYVTDAAWLPYLQQAAQQGGWQTQLHYAVALAENGREQQAEQLLKSMEQQNNPWAAYTLGALARRRSEHTQARDYFVKAYQYERGALDVSFAEEALAAFIATGEYAQAWQLFNEIPEACRTEKELLLAAEAAVKLEHFEFLDSAFQREYAAIREGAAGLSEIWYEYRARMRARAKGVAYSADMIDYTETLPEHLNFLMFCVDAHLRR